MEFARFSELYLENNHLFVASKEKEKRDGVKLSLPELTFFLFPSPPPPSQTVYGRLQNLFSVFSFCDEEILGEPVEEVWRRACQIGGLDPEFVKRLFKCKKVRFFAYHLICFSEGRKVWKVNFKSECVIRYKIFSRLNRSLFLLASEKTKSRKAI